MLKKFKLNKLVFILLLSTSITLQAKVKIAFWINFLSMRGVEVSVYDFADFNETILGNESIILNNLKMFNDPKYDNIFKIDYNNTVREKFIKRFGNRFFDCEDIEVGNCIMMREKVDIFYTQKGGEPSEICSSVCKNIFHAVFNIQPHGDAYASISNWLRIKFKAPQVPLVPLIIRLDDTKENLRAELGIPQNAVVFGRHGGTTTFDIHFAAQAVREMAQQHPDWYFVFLNTNRFCDLKNVIFLPGTADLVYKTKFINMCDAMIHARIDGETFGLAVGEFSIKNKPVITCLSGDQAHIEILGDKGFYYTNKQELTTHINHIGHNINVIREGNWDCYSKDFSPEAVMKKFDEIFIQPVMSQKG